MSAIILYPVIHPVLLFHLRFHLCAFVTPLQCSKAFPCNFINKHSYFRWGTEELFKDDELSTGEGTDSEGKKINENEIVWDDAAIDALLDRNRDTDNKVCSSLCLSSFLGSSAVMEAVE